jgi:hypothetical protein
LKKEGLNFAELASLNRRHNYIKKLAANEDQIESLISNLLNHTKSIPIEKTGELLNQFYELSKSQDIPLSEVSEYVNQKIEEKGKLEEEIERAGAILESNNIDIQMVEEYKRMDEELEKYGLSMESPSKLVSVLQKINQFGYDPQKIISFVAWIKSLKQTERILKNSCKVLESYASRYKEIIPLCGQIKRLGIGFSELAAFHVAVMKKSDVEKIPYGNAAFALMDGIDTSNKLLDARKQLNDIWMQVQMLNLFSARQNDALTALRKLQSYGVTLEEILNIYGILNSARPENARRIMHGPLDYSLFKSNG